MSQPTMIDWQKDAIGTMWNLSALGWKQQGFSLTDEDRQYYINVLKENVARMCRMATQKTGGQRQRIGDLHTTHTQGITAWTIIIAAVHLCLDEKLFGPMPEKIESDRLFWEEPE